MEKKTKVRIYDTYDEDEHFLLLRESELAFLKWLSNEFYLREDIRYIVFDEEKTPIEF